MHRGCGGVLVLLALTAGCGQGDSSVVAVNSNDPGMKTAISKARASSGQLIAALAARPPGATDFAIKKMFRDANGTEHIWLTNIHYNGKKFTGEVGNKPEIVQYVKLGEKESVERDEITDWMYVQKGKLMGGYSIRLLRDRASPEERKKMDASVPFQFD